MRVWTTRVALGGCLLGFLVAAPAAAVDRLYVSSFQNGTIQRYDLPSPVPTTVVSGLFFPEDGACSPTTGLVYFAESQSSIITRWDQDGNGATNIVPAAGSVEGPEGLSFDAQGNLYFNTREAFGSTEGAWRIDNGDPANAAVQVAAPFTAWGEGSDIVRGGPHAGALLLVARAEQRIWMSEPPGAPLQLLIDATAFTPGSELFGIVANGCGEVFVAERAPGSSPSSVLRFDPDGNFIDVFATGLDDANFMELDSLGNLYVSDETAGTIWQIAPDKTMTVFANVFSSIGLAMCRDELVPSCDTISCDAGGPYEAECQGAETCFTLNGTNSASTAGPVAFSWTSDCPGADFGGTETSSQPTLCIEAPDCETRCKAYLTVADGVQTDSCEADVTVVDTTPPVLPGSNDDLACLWPPNHWYVCFDIADVLPEGEDCHDVSWEIVGCESDQPDDARESDPGSPWNGDGHTVNDCVILPGGQGVCVRSERAGTGPTAQDGRHYGIAVAGTDECGNASQPVTVGSIHVPHDQSPHERPCLDPTKVGCRPNQDIPCPLRRPRGLKAGKGGSGGVRAR